MYKWVDKKGIMHFSDTPPTSKQNVKTIKTRNYPKPSPSQSSVVSKTQIETETSAEKTYQKKTNNKRKEKRSYTNEVAIYTTSW